MHYKHHTFTKLYIQVKHNAYLFCFLVRQFILGHTDALLSGAPCKGKCDGGGFHCGVLRLLRALPMHFHPRVE